MSIDPAKQPVRLHITQRDVDLVIKALLDTVAHQRAGAGPGGPLSEDHRRMLLIAQHVNTASAAARDPEYVRVLPTGTIVPLRGDAA